MKAGLYHPDQFKDNCGFGLIAHMQGEASHHLLKTAIEALTCMTHRGGINADGKTGDGCGLLIQKPDQFLRAVAKEHFAVDLPKQYAVGMVFFNQDPAKAEADFVAEYREKFFNPYRAADVGQIDEVIEPCETRPRLARALEVLRTKVQQNPPKKHGLCPV